jgi:hypothetical protein
MVGYASTKANKVMDYPALRKVQLESRRLRDKLIQSPYAFPGGYPMLAVTSDGGALCKDCCKSESRSIGTTCGNDGWQVVGLSINYEDKDLHCDHCNQPIECAYGD